MNIDIRFNECECCGRYNELHITKFSFGRKPLFQAHRWLPAFLEKKTGLTSICSIADRKKVMKHGRIFTEYGEVRDSKKFWKEVEKKEGNDNRELESHRDGGYSFTFAEFS